MALDLNRELCLSGWLEGPGECMTAKEVKSSSVQVTITSISHPSFVSHRGLLIQIIVLPLSPLLSLAAVIQTNVLSVSLHSRHVLPRSGELPLAPTDMLQHRGFLYAFLKGELGGTGMPVAGIVRLSK